MIHCAAFVRRKTTSASTLMLWKKSKRKKEQVKRRESKTVMNPLSSQCLAWTEDNANFRFVEGQYIQPQNDNNWEPKFMSP